MTQLDPTRLDPVIVSRGPSFTDHDPKVYQADLTFVPVSEPRTSTVVTLSIDVVPYGAGWSTIELTEAELEKLVFEGQCRLQELYIERTYQTEEPS
jgi:hypothetical protein